MNPPRRIWTKRIGAVLESLRAPRSLGEQQLHDVVGNAIAAKDLHLAVPRSPGSSQTRLNLVAPCEVDGADAATPIPEGAGRLSFSTRRPRLRVNPCPTVQASWTNKAWFQSVAGATRQRLFSGRLRSLVLSHNRTDRRRLPTSASSVAQLPPPIWCARRIALPRANDT